MKRLFLLIGLLAGLCHNAHADNPRVVIETELGDIVIEVMVDKAPVSGGDFLTYVKKGLYDGEGFYRVVRSADNDNGTPKIDVIQGGILAEGMGLNPVAHETTEATGIKHTDGTVSLARGDVGTGSAAYIFITVGDQPSLDFGGTRNPDKQGFAAFGRVIDGMDVVRKIHNLTPDLFELGDGYMAGQLLKEPVRINKTTRTSVEFGETREQH
ncbi:MAG: peptidylprolyl isomerase [Woeseiaceae bacterium]